MLYNSYGLFFYKCQLIILKLLAGPDLKRRFYWIKQFRFNKEKGKSEVYDSYINPQVKTFSIEDVKSWAKDRNLTIVGIVPPLEFNLIIKYAVMGQNYIFRRKRIFSIALNISKLFSGLGKKSHERSLKLPIVKTIFYQLIFLILGKGECQYLLEKQE